MGSTQMKNLLMLFFGYFNELVDKVVGNNAYQCSATTHSDFDIMLVMDLIIAIAGFIVWRKFIRTKPVKVLLTNEENVICDFSHVGRDNANL